MCGIAGFTGFGNESNLKNMIQSIRHRGPDAQAIFWKDNLGLAHARLSILDLREEGNQPMFSEDKKIIITFNGEIYNYLELKKTLSTKYHFKTTTDTEVLLYLYKEFGVNMLSKIHGMFAFALYDVENETLFLAKDRIGKKPLYYTCQNGAFVFASELKAILTHPSVEKTVSYEAINQYLTFDYIPTPNSLVENVYKLEPATYLIVKENNIIEKQNYWRYDFKCNKKISFNNAKEQLDFLLDKATKKRLMADVPLGVFLSGGIDSSAIAYYAQKNSTQKIKTFSIGFEDTSYDEANYAKIVSNNLQTDHHSEILTPQNTIKLLDEILPLVDEPFADASLIPTYFLSKFTKEHVTVALGGDGSDELLAGYPTFISNYFRKFFAFLPKSVISILIAAVNKLFPISDKNISLDFKINQFLRGFLSSKVHTHQLWLGSFTPDEKKKLFRTEIYLDLKDKSGLSIIDSHYKNCDKNWSNLSNELYYYCQTYLVDDILVKVDRASMYSSLEVRSPFLDTHVVEFINSLPDNFKMKFFNGKYILKKIMENKLPNDIIYRSKKGFGIPLSEWIRKDLKSEIQSTLLNSKNQIFNLNFIDTILNEHFSGKKNNRKLIWNLYILMKTLDNYDLKLN